MTFQLKDFDSITLSQINHAKSVTDKVTDFLPGSVVRTIMEAPAVEIEDLYLQVFLGLRDAIPVATFQSFGFVKLPAMTAIGWVNIITEGSPLFSPITIPAGTQFSSPDGRIYLSTDTVTWEISTPVMRVRVAYTSAGTIGNIAEGAINASPLFAPNSFNISNSTIDNGRDAETDTEREARFSAYIESLSRGTVVAVLYAARQSTVLDEQGNVFEYVTRAGLTELPGLVRIYLYSNGGIPSEALLADGQLRIDGSRDDLTGVITPGFRAAGVRVDVLPMVERAVSLEIKVAMFDGFVLNSAVELELDAIFSDAIRAVAPGSVLYLGTLVESLLAVGGVKTIVPVSESNIQCGASEALTPGTLTVSPL